MGYLEFFHMQCGHRIDGVAGIISVYILDHSNAEGVPECDGPEGS